MWPNNFNYDGIKLDCLNIFLVTLRLSGDIR